LWPTEARFSPYGHPAGILGCGLVNMQAEDADRQVAVNIMLDNMSGDMLEAIYFRLCQLKEEIEKQKAAAAKGPIN
jgi:hypothetical protein